jgi:hypothetical protein
VPWDKYKWLLGAYCRNVSSAKLGGYISCVRSVSDNLPVAILVVEVMEQSCVNMPLMQLLWREVQSGNLTSRLRSRMRPLPRPPSFLSELLHHVTWRGLIEKYMRLLIIQRPLARQGPQPQMGWFEGGSWREHLYCYIFRLSSVISYTCFTAREGGI